MSDVIPLPDLPEEERLAAEYVLGVLTGEERADVERRIAHDPAFADLVDDWTVRLMTIEESTKPAQPPGAVKARLDAALFGNDETTATRLGSLMQSLVLWRAATALSLLALIGVVFSTLVDRPAPPPEPTRFAAALVSETSPANLLAVVDVDTGQLSLEGDLAPLADLDGRDPELWLIGPDGVPVSLGVVVNSGARELTPAPQLLAQLTEGAVLAVSVEPEGGSPTGAPTGPVIALGPLRAL